MKAQCVHTDSGLCETCFRYERVNAELVAALRSVDDWFERMKKDHYEKLIHHQTLESASKNWDSLLQEPLEMEPIKKALAHVEELNK